MIRTTITLAFAAIAIAVPVAQAESPDAFERAVSIHHHALSANAGQVERRSPDVQDAALAARLRHQGDDASYAPLDPAIATAIEARRRLSGAPLDPAIATAIRTHRSSAASVPTTAAPVSQDRFDWSDFAVGAGAVLALVLALGRLRRGVLTLRTKQA
jgi:hypothetical protein